MLGVNSRTAKLANTGESGALNEANSDILGTMVEFYTNAPGDAPDYLIGEKVIAAGGGKALSGAMSCPIKSPLA